MSKKTMGFCCGGDVCDVAIVCVFVCFFCVIVFVFVDLSTLCLNFFFLASDRIFERRRNKQKPPTVRGMMCIRGNRKNLRGNKGVKFRSSVDSCHRFFRTNNREKGNGTYVIRTCDYASGLSHHAFNQKLARFFGRYYPVHWCTNRLSEACVHFPFEIQLPALLPFLANSQTNQPTHIPTTLDLG